MEALLFTLFFLASLVFFISGKDDFGRKEKRLIIKNTEKEMFKKEVGFDQRGKVKKEVELEST